MDEDEDTYAAARARMVAEQIAGRGEIWVTHGQEDALVHWCQSNGLKARPLALVGYGDEDEGEAAVDTQGAADT